MNLSHWLLCVVVACLGWLLIYARSFLDEQ